MTYEQALDYIHSRIHLGSRRGLFRMEALLKKLGNPEMQLQFVHIAGSNGKGSTAALCESVLRHAGYKTGLFVSPFVFDFRERMQVDCELVDGQFLADTLESIIPALDEMKDEGMECTEFETLTALALVLFARAGVEVVVFEVGIGGLLDSTNVIPPPLCAALTAVSLEHTNILGDTIHDIAVQKCGIIKPGSRAAGYCDLHPDADAVIRETCTRLGVPLSMGDKTALQVLESDDTGSVFAYRGKTWRIGLPGLHQVYNALTVLSIVEQLRLGGMELPEAAVEDGLKNARFAGRLQVVRQEPKCIIDGAHNPGKMDALCAALDSLYPGRPLIAVAGMMARKDWQHTAPQLARRCRIFIAVRPDESELSLPAEELAEFIHAHCAEVYCCNDPEDGARLAVQLSQPEDVLVACGSMYLLEGAKKGFVQNAD